MVDIDPRDFYQKPKPMFPRKDATMRARKCERCGAWPAPVIVDGQRLCGRCHESGSDDQG